MADEVAALTGLPANHNEKQAGDWSPFGHDDDHKEAAEHVEEHAGASKPQSTSGALASLTHGIKRLGETLRGDKSHRFSDLLHLHAEVKRDLTDHSLYPELAKDATLRRENTLSRQELAFLESRRHHIVATGALKRFLRLDENEEVNVEDVPICALGGSGGGYRACLGFLSFIEQMQCATDAEGNTPECSSDLWDLMTYVAGVSGSCWSIAGLYSTASMDASKLLDRFARSSQHHPLSMTAVDAVARSANGIYFQLAPILQKIRVGHLHPGPLDLYGTLVTSHIFFNPGVLQHNSGDDACSSQKTHVALHRDWFRFSKIFESCSIDKGAQPLPILTAIRHERPWRDWKSPEEAFGASNHKAAEHNDRHAWWQWFEFSPLEFGSDELEGWIPTWAFGRTFQHGKSTQRLPERSLSLLLGICTSAPAGPLAAWLATVYRNLPKGVLGSKIRHAADAWVEAHPEQAERLQSHHPVHAMNEPNPFFGAEKQDGRGQGFENSPRIHLVDAGMSNNLPHYTFFRPGREVDLMLLCDFSSDVQSGEALQRIRSFGEEMGVRTEEREKLPDLNEWPQVAADADAENPEGKVRRKELTSDEIAERFRGRYAQVLDVEPIPEDQRSACQGPTITDPATGLRYNARHQPQSTRSTTMVYMPLLPHRCQPLYDPSTASFSSSYNLVWSEEQVSTIRRTARANVEEAMETIRGTMREIYERKKQVRLTSSSAGSPA
jgi:phospholipase A2